MTDTIADALELLGQPAALFECPGMVHVAANAAAGRAARLIWQERGIEIRNAPEMLEILGVDLDKARALLQGEKGYFARETPYGILYMTRMPGSPELSRPDLLLATLHPATSREAAYMAHHRMLTMVSANELGHRSLRMLEDALIQVQAALSAQHAMIEETNRRAEEFFRMEVGRRDLD